MTPEQLRNIEATHVFWQRFFNEEDMEAFERFVDLPNYHHNGARKDGTQLKAWIRGLQAVSRLNVEILRSVPDGDRVAIYWVARPTRKTDHLKLPSVQGINTLVFDGAGRVVQNWSCRSALV